MSFFGKLAPSALFNLLNTTALIEMGNQAQAALKVGFSSILSRVNWIEIGTSAASDTPSIIANGPGANVQMIIATKGTSTGNLRGGASTVLTWSSVNIGVTRPLLLASFTVATVPAAATHPAGIIYVSDGTTNKRLAVSDGTNWRWPDGAIVS